MFYLIKTLLSLSIFCLFISCQKDNTIINQNPLQIAFNKISASDDQITFTIVAQQASELGYYIEQMNGEGKLPNYSAQKLHDKAILLPKSDSNYVVIDGCTPQTSYILWGYAQESKGGTHSITTPIHVKTSERLSRSITTTVEDLTPTSMKLVFKANNNPCSAFWAYQSAEEGYIPFSTDQIISANKRIENLITTYSVELDNLLDQTPYIIYTVSQATSNSQHHLDTIMVTTPSFPETSDLCNPEFTKGSITNHNGYINAVTFNNEEYLLKISLQNPKSQTFTIPSGEYKLSTTSSGTDSWVISATTSSLTNIKTEEVYTFIKGSTLVDFDLERAVYTISGELFTTRNERVSFRFEESLEFPIHLNYTESYFDAASSLLNTYTSSSDYELQLKLRPEFEFEPGVYTLEEGDILPSSTINIKFNENLQSDQRRQHQIKSATMIVEPYAADNSFRYFRVHLITQEGYPLVVKGSRGSTQNMALLDLNKPTPGSNPKYKLSSLEAISFGDGLPYYYKIEAEGEKVAKLSLTLEKTSFDPIDASQIPMGTYQYANADGLSQKLKVTLLDGTDFQFQDEGYVHVSLLNDTKYIIDIKVKLRGMGNEYFEAKYFGEIEVADYTESWN